MRINQATRKLVVGVGREAVIDKELGLRVQSFRVSLHQSVDLGARGFGPTDCVSTGQAGEILPEAVAGNEAVEVVPSQTEASQVIPPAHVFAGGREARDLAKYLQQTIIVQIRKTGMILIKLPFHRSFKQLNVGVREGGQRRRNGNGAPV